MPAFENRSTCLIACLLNRPRAAANPWPMVETANDALVIIPCVAFASEYTRFACRSSPTRLIIKLWMSCGQKIKTVGKAGVVPSWRGLAACRPLRFFGAINGALCGSAGKWGETYGMGTYPGLHHRDGGPGAAAAELV